MRLLAVDTALEACAAALVTIADGRLDIVAETRIIGRGHAECLMAVIETVLAESGARLDGLDGFAAVVGPGSFTGIRVGVAAVRGFAVALDRPAIGVGTLEALAEEARAARPGRAILAVLDARKDEVYAATFAADGTAFGAAAALPRAEAAARARDLDAVLIGSGAPLLAALEPTLDIATAAAFPSIDTVARIAMERFDHRRAPLAATPFYVRPPDAKPQGAARLARLTPPGAVPLREGRP